MGQVFSKAAFQGKSAVICGGAGDIAFEIASGLAA
jgi:hypothetical protein